VRTYLASIAFVFAGIKDLLTPRFRYGVGDPRVERLELLRTAGGIVVTLGAWLAYQQVGYDSIMGSLGNVMVNAAMAIPAVVVGIGIGILLATTAREQRPSVLRAVRRPAVTVPACLAAGLAFDSSWVPTRTCRARPWRRSSPSSSSSPSCST